MTAGVDGDLRAVDLHNGSTDLRGRAANTHLSL